MTANLMPASLYCHLLQFTFRESRDIAVGIHAGDFVPLLEKYVAD
jgi:hypothetical protein